MSKQQLPFLPPLGAAVPGLLCLLALLAATACAPASASTAGGNALTVAAAADLQPPFAEIGRMFEQTSGSRVTFSFGSSGNLAAQIENGAPIDLFASADEEYVQRLVAKGLASPDTVRVYGLGRLALVTFRNSGLAVLRLEDLATPGVKHVSIANPEHAPYGVAARQAMMAAGVWDQVRPKVVYGENVRQALQFVQTGNAEAGIVALSIADAPEVSSIMVDESLYRPLRQALAVVKGAKQERLAGEFASFVTGPNGRPVMAKYGFMPPEGK